MGNEEKEPRITTIRDFVGVARSIENHRGMGTVFGTNIHGDSVEVAIVGSIGRNISNWYNHPYTPEEIGDFKTKLAKFIAEAINEKLEREAESDEE